LNERRSPVPARGSQWTGKDVCGEFHDPVVFFMNGSGDAVTHLPAIRALAHRLNGIVTLVTGQAPYAALYGDLPLRKIVRVSGARRPCFDYAAVVAQVERCDLFVSLVPWWSRDLDKLRELLQPTLSVGLGSGFDWCIQPDPCRHSGQVAFDVVRTIWADADMDSFLDPIEFRAESKHLATQIAQVLPPEARWLVVHTDTSADKMWPRVRFSEVLQRFLYGHEEYVVLIVGLHDPEMALPMDLDERVISLLGAPFWSTAYVVAVSDLFFGIDSSFMHVADLCRVPSVALFGPTTAAQFGFLVGPNRTLQGAASTLSISVDAACEALEDMHRVAGHIVRTTRTPPAEEKGGRPTTQDGEA
jgi:hypothetical protein